MTPASIVIPTRERPRYLEVALSSIAPQAARAGAELLVVDDAVASEQMRELSERLGARYVPHGTPRGLNAARNTGVARSHGELVVFVDDDVAVRPGWLEGLLAAARAHPDVDVFTGPVHARLEGRPPRSCGREQPPITALELGERDTDARFAWGANMAIRRRALERLGPFDVTLAGAGDEQEWQERLRAREPAARVLYVGAAALDHRRSAEDTRLRVLARGAYARGRAARRFDARRGRAPSLWHELTTLVGCAAHVVRRRCPAGVMMVAHSAGRVRACREPTASSPAGEDPPPASPAGEDFLSGVSDTVGGLDSLRRRVRDTLADAGELAGGRRARLARAARSAPPQRRVLVLGVVRPEQRARAAASARELLRSRHDVELHTLAPAGAGKFENLNLLLERHPAAGHDWLLVVDDDVELPRGFLDRMLFLCERFSLALAQPAHRLDSHAAWEVTRRRPQLVARETNFVEIGPVTAFARETFAQLLPFPELRMGWGLDVHWAAVARAHGWRCGVIDAVAVRHRAVAVARDYRREEAVAEARAFLAGREHVTAAEAQRTLAAHERW